MDIPDYMPIYVQYSILYSTITTKQCLHLYMYTLYSILGYGADSMVVYSLGVFAISMDLIPQQGLLSSEVYTGITHGLGWYIHRRFTKAASQTFR